jgi:hypothetical protein
MTLRYDVLRPSATRRVDFKEESIIPRQLSELGNTVNVQDNGFNAPSATVENISVNRDVPEMSNVSICFGPSTSVCSTVELAASSTW